MKIDFEQLTTLVDLVQERGLAELTLKQEDQKITIKTGVAQAVMPPINDPRTVGLVPYSSDEVPVVDVEAVEQETQETSNSNYYQVTSPMVGTFYKSPSPDSDPFVAVGSVVSKGQTLCIIEAMKLMNELECEVNGVVKKVCVDDAQPIEFGQVLFEIEVQ